MVAWVLSIVIRFALSRQREYLADSGSVELTKNPDAMITALRKIEGRGELARANSAVMEMCIDNPRVGFSNLFDTHPSVDARVEALVKFAGGHDPGPLALEAPQAQPQLENQPAGTGPWGDAPAAPAPQSGPGAQTARAETPVVGPTARVIAGRRAVSSALDESRSRFILSAAAVNDRTTTAPAGTLQSFITAWVMSDISDFFCSSSGRRRG